MSQFVQEGSYNGENAVLMRFGDYEATILPEWGGNLIAFNDVRRAYRFIRTPSSEEMDRFKSQPTAYGIPVLFPPNRYEDGQFKVNGICYQLPVNEPRTGNHLHGFLYNRPWQVVHMGHNAAEVFVELVHVIDAEDDIYAYFPHAFQITIRYSLSAEGLCQKTTVKNTGSIQMPCMLGFHTAIHVPFAPNSSIKDYRCIITIDKRLELSKRMLPTGKALPLSWKEVMMKTTGISPFFKPMDDHYTSAPQQNRNFMMLTDLREGVTLVYDVGLQYKYWMIWNDEAKGGFFCPEPQTNMVNAPNVNTPMAKRGLYFLDPGETWSETSKMYTKQV